MDIEDRKILVTGGAGFIGSNLVKELVGEKAKVVVYDNFCSGDLSNLREVEKRITIIEGDILDPGFKDILEENQIECVFNLAAEPYIPYCYYRPKKFFEVNASGALNILLACRDSKVKRIVQYSTSEVYGSARYVPMEEHHPTFPLSTYAVSKLAADRLCYTLHHEQEIPVIILRQFNAYGPGETQPYIVPEIITPLERGDKLKLGNLKARRDLTYVEDAVKASVALMKCDDAVGEVVNVGTGIDWSVEEIARTIGKLMGYSKIKIEVEKARLRPLDVERLQCSYFKLYKLTGWNPQVDFKEGLRRTIDYYVGAGKKWLWETKIAPEEEVWRKK